MANIDYLQELSDKEIPEEILLLYALNGNNYLLQILYNYRIYGKTCEKLFELCEKDFDKFSKTLTIIERTSYITLEIVHVNLNFDEPIPFLSTLPKNGIFDEIEIYFQGIEFIKKYDKKIDEIINEHKTMFPR